MDTNLLKKPFLHIALIALLALAAYSNTFNVPYAFDDEGNIALNPIVGDLGYFADPSSAQGMARYSALMGRYVGYLSFALNYAVHGNDVRGYHVINLLVHVISSLLVYAIVMLLYATPLLRASGPKHAWGMALFAAGVFAAHPLQTQAVTYIVQRLSSMSAMFGLLGVWAYLKYRQMESKPSRLWYVLALVALLLAMKTKENAFTFPMLIVLAEAVFYGRQGRAGIERPRMWGLVPVVLTMLVVPLGIISYGNPGVEAVEGVKESFRLKTVMPRSVFMLTELRVVVTYLRLFVFPAGQNIEHDFELSVSPLEPAVLGSGVFLAGLFGLAVYLAVRPPGRRQGWRVAGFGVLWFFITLSVESGLVPIHSVIYEHRMYMPLAGLAMAAAACGGEVYDLFIEQNTQQSAIFKRVLIALAVAIPIVLGAAAFKRNMVWQSGIALWSDVVAKNPHNARARYNLALYLDREQRTDEAIAQYREAVRLDTAAIMNRLALVSRAVKAGDERRAEIYDMLVMDYHSVAGEAWFGLAMAYLDQGRFDEAKSAFAKLEPGDKEYQSARRLIGYINGMKGK